MGASSHIPPHSDDTDDNGSSPLLQAVRWFRDKVTNKPEGSIKEMIAEALEEDAEVDSALSDDEKQLLKNIIHFGELTVNDIMVPRSDILAVSAEKGFDDWKRYVVDMGHTRIPVYQDSLDKILGFVHVKDLFMHLVSDLPFDINRLLRDILFVPPSMRIVDLLMKMRVSGCHIAIVVDEYGGTDGLVTMEDLFEELVGEIQDEHDSLPLHMLHWVNDHTLEADARVDIEEVETALKQKLRGAEEDEADYDTLGGFLFSNIGRVPAKGEVVKLENLKFDIIAADPRRIRMVRITRTA